MRGLISSIRARLAPKSKRREELLAVKDATDPVAYEWLRLGVRAAIANNREDARYYFVQAVRTDLNYARAWLYLGGVADDPALTLSCLRKALQLDPTEPNVHEGIRWARERLGMLNILQMPQTPQATPEPALPDNIIDLSALGAPRRADPPEDREEALRLALASVVSPTDQDQDELYEDEIGELTDSVMLLTRARQASAKPPETPNAAPQPAPQEPTRGGQEGSKHLLQRGLRSAQEGNRQRARYFFLKAIIADPTYTLAWLYFGGIAQDPAVTLACMERVLQADPINVDAQAGVKWALSQLGMQGPAMRWWRQ